MNPCNTDLKHGNYIMLRTISGQTGKQCSHFPSLCTTDCLLHTCDCLFVGIKIDLNLAFKKCNYCIVFVSFLVLQQFSFPTWDKPSTTIPSIPFDYLRATRCEMARMT